MKIFKTIITFSDFKPGEIFVYDTIEFEGKLWIVPEWLIDSSLKRRKPKRIIALDNFLYEAIDRGKHPFRADFRLNNPIYRGILYSQTPMISNVQENPEIWYDIHEWIDIQELFFVFHWSLLLFPKSLIRITPWSLVLQFLPFYVTFRVTITDKIYGRFIWKAKIRLQRDHYNNPKEQFFLNYVIQAFYYLIFELVLKIIWPC